MAYTIPEYVDTPEQAILAVASAVKGEQVTGGDGNVGTALDILADALAGENVEVPMTQQGAILALAQYVGGGGGVDVGAPTFVVKSNSAPEVDDSMPNKSAIAGLAIGDATIVPVMPNGNVLAVASGVTATTGPDMELEPTTCDAYVVTVTRGVITAAAPWDGTLTPGTVTDGHGALNVWTFTVPALTFDKTTFSGQALYLYMH